MVYCDCLENSWVMSPGGSNPSPSACGEAWLEGRRAKHALIPGGIWLPETTGSFSHHCIAAASTLQRFVGVSYAGKMAPLGKGKSGAIGSRGAVFGRTVKYSVTLRVVGTV